MTSPADGPELPAGWARLHPLSPVARGGGGLLVLAFVTVPRQLVEGRLQTPQLLLDAVGGVLLVALGVVSWLVTRWRVDGGELQLETGLLRRQSLRVPLRQVQAVDVVRPFAARLLGLSEVRLVLAGGGTGRARLAFLPHVRAGQVRAQLLALGTAPAPLGAVEQVLTRVPNGRLIASTLLGPGLLVLAVLLVPLAVTSPRDLGGLLPAQVPTLLALLGPALRRLNVELGFTLAEAPDGLRLRSGLFQTRAETVPAGRVQAVRLVEPLLWRPFGWCRLEVDVAQQRERAAGEQDVRQLTRALLPVGSRLEAEQLLARVLPGAVTAAPPGAGAPRRARLKAPLSWPRLASWHDPAYLVCRTGRLQARTVVVPLAKAQSVRWEQGPVQRRLRLATVTVDTAGARWRATARDRDEDEALALVERLPALARAARRPS